MNKPKRIPNQKTHKQFWTRTKLIITSVLIVISFLIGLLSGSVQFGVAYLRCGRAPVMLQGHALIGFSQGSGGYVLPGDRFIYKPHYYTKYFCNEQEAINSGAQINPLSEESLNRRSR